MQIDFEIKEMLKDYATASSVFENLTNNNEIAGWQRIAEKLCQSKMINRHDVLHASTVTKYSIEIFTILEKTRSLEPSIYEIPPRQPFEGSLILTLVASYCHDIARSLARHSDKALAVLINLMRDIGIPKELYDDFVPMVMVLTGNHGGDRMATFHEESILILADGADCDENRPRPEYTKIDALREGLVKGRSPIHYYSCKAIKGVKISQGSSNDRPLNFTFSIKDGAAAFQLEDFLKRIRNTNLKKLIEAKVIWGNDEFIFWPSPT